MIRSDDIKIQNATIKDLNEIHLLELECFQGDAFSKQ